MTETYEVKKVEKDDERDESVARSFLKLRVFASIVILVGVILVVTR